MIQIGVMIFYEADTGRVITHIPAQQYPDEFPVRTVEDTIQNYPLLRDRDPATYGVIQLEYGEHQEDFMLASSFQVDPETKKILFTYPDPNNPEVPPTPQPPLTEQVAMLKQENTLLKAQNNALTERTEFIEDVIAEMAQQVYQ